MAEQGSSYALAPCLGQGVGFGDAGGARVADDGAGILAGGGDAQVAERLSALVSEEEHIAGCGKPIRPADVRRFVRLMRPETGCGGDMLEVRLAKEVYRKVEVKSLDVLRQESSKKLGVFIVEMEKISDIGMNPRSKS
jgi:hypothetical protein